MVVALAPSSAPFATRRPCQHRLGLVGLTGDQQRLGQRGERPVILGVARQGLHQPAGNPPRRFAIVGDQRHGGGVDPRIVALLVLEQAVIGLERCARLFALIFAALRLERLLLEQPRVERREILDQLSLELSLARPVGTVEERRLVLAITIVDERIADDAVHRQERILARLAHGVLERIQAAGHRETRACQQVERALRVAASRRGERRAVMQLRTRRVVAQNVEPDIAGADQVAAGDRGVDIADGAFERGAAAGGAQAGQSADALIIEDLDLLAARAGAQQSGALPLVEPAADGLAADAEIGGDMLLRDLARKTHAIAFGDADIRRQLD